MTTQDVCNVFRNSKAFQPEPPIPLYRPLPPSPPFPVEALGETLRPLIEAIHQKTQAPIELVAQSVLATTSLIAQGYCDVELFTGEQKPCSLFFITIANSGERKSTCDRIVLQPIRKHEQSLRESYPQELDRYQTALEVWEAKKRDILSPKNAKNKTKDTLTKEVEALGAKPQGPKQPIMTCQEPTMEGYLKLSIQGQPSIGLFSDEGGSFINGHAMKDDVKLRTAAGLSQLWDGTVLNRVRSIDGCETIEGKRLALHLMVQPEIGQQFLSDRVLLDQGLLSRCLVSYPNSTMGRRLQKVLPPEIQTVIDDTLKKLYEMLQKPLPYRDNGQNILKPHVLALAPDAQDLCLEFADHVEKNLGPDGLYTNITGLANKLPEHATRLAAVLQFIESETTVPITAKNIRYGIALAQFYADEALRLFSRGHIPKQIVLAEKLKTWLLNQWEEPFISLPDIYQCGPSAIRDKNKAQKIVAILIEHGYLIPCDAPQIINGKPRQKAWQIVREGEV